jgi:zinc-binding in reverse transcriptase
VVGNGHSINFWLDNWCNDYPLSVQFPLVYAKTKSSLVSLHEVWNNGNFKLNLTRGASIAMRHEKTQLLSSLSSLSLTTTVDSAVWLWDPTGLYTVNSLYTFLCCGGVTVSLSKSVWVLKIPIKNKLFLWMVLNNKILTRDNLRKKGWVGDGSCVFCNFQESVNHLFLHCPAISGFWSTLISHYPSLRSFTMTSLLTLWDSCVLSSDFPLYGTLLAACVWVV